MFPFETMKARRTDSGLEVECSVAEVAGYMLARALEIGKVSIEEVELGDPDCLKVDNDGSGRGPMIRMTYPIKGTVA